jgi:hypothetical protein
MTKDEHQIPKILVETRTRSRTRTSIEINAVPMEAWSYGAMDL